jgi:diguanylate cyclase (GGDEF)-like protein
MSEELKQSCLGIVYGMEACVGGEIAVELQIGKVCIDCLVYAHEELVHHNSFLTTQVSELSEAVRTDWLTKISNRFGLEMALERLVSSEVKFGLLFVDLANFRAVNKRRSHIVGDSMLIETAQFLHEQLREEDALVGRFGGDEFCIVVSENQEIGGERAGLLPLEDRLDIIKNRLTTNYESLDVIAGYNLTYSNEDKLSLRIESAAWAPGIDIRDLLQSADPKFDNRELRNDDQ